MNDMLAPSNVGSRFGPLRTSILLVAVLAVTTGWVQPPGQIAVFEHPSGGRVADDGTRMTPPAGEEAFAAGSGGRAAPQRHPTAAPKEATSGTPSVTASAHAYAGRNHFWIPSLGISQQVYWYSCGRTRAPANLIYRWGCGGTNNVYILGHAWGVMKPLHDAYVAGRLHVGMLAIYADGNGNIRSYRVTAWQVVRPTVVAWATASQPVPSMTLQTCIGATSQYRLDVRLVAVD